MHKFDDNCPYEIAQWISDFERGYITSINIVNENPRDVYNKTAPGSRCKYILTGAYTTESYVDTPEFIDIEAHTPFQYKKQIRYYVMKIDEIRCGKVFNRRQLFQLGFHVGQLEKLGMKLRMPKVAAFIDHYSLDNIESMVQYNDADIDVDYDYDEFINDVV